MAAKNFLQVRLCYGTFDKIKAIFFNGSARNWDNF